MYGPPAGQAFVGLGEGGAGVGLGEARGCGLDAAEHLGVGRAVQGAEALVGVVAAGGHGEPVLAPVTMLRGGSGGREGIAAAEGVRERRHTNTHLSGLMQGSLGEDSSTPPPHTFSHIASMVPAGGSRRRYFDNPKKYFKKKLATTTNILARTRRDERTPSLAS